MDKFSVNIDFEEASKEWRRNKKNMGHGFFQYRCGAQKSRGKYCRKLPHSIQIEQRVRKCKPLFGEWEYCSYHKKCNTNAGLSFESFHSVN